MDAAQGSRGGSGLKEKPMLKWALIFLLVGLAAGALGFSGVAGAAVGIAKVLFFLFITLFIVMLILGVTIYKRLT